MARALAVSVIGFAVASTWMPAQAVADPQPASTAFAIGKCFDPSEPAQERPTRFAYNCDDTGVMDDMTWTAWGADGAEGTGTDRSIECQPNCAQGDAARQSDRRARMESVAAERRRLPAGCSVLLRSDHRLPEERATLDHSGNDVGGRNRLRDHRRHARRALL